MIPGFNKFQGNTSFSVDETVTYCNTLSFGQLRVILTRQLHAYRMPVHYSTYKRCNMLVISLE